jgi:membrane-anchored glycerophosphoryl diester phosphodiesterase (GDPDase)
LPPSPSPDKRTAFIIWIVVLVVGSALVWWLSAYLDRLTTMGQTDREGALALFKSRALPVLLAVVAIVVAAGVILLRQGLQMINAAREAADPSDPTRASMRRLGSVLAAAGFVMAAVPLVFISLVFWLLRRA